MAPSLKLTVKKMFEKGEFLVACYATLQPALSVRRSVRWSVRRSHFTFFGFLVFLASLLLPE